MERWTDLYKHMNKPHAPDKLYNLSMQNQSIIFKLWTNKTVFHIKIKPITTKVVKLEISSFTEKKKSKYWSFFFFNYLMTAYLKWIEEYMDKSCFMDYTKTFDRMK